MFHRGLLIEDSGKYHFIALSRQNVPIEEPINLIPIFNNKLVDIEKFFDIKIVENKEYYCTYPQVRWDLGSIGDPNIKFEDLDNTPMVEEYFYKLQNFKNFKETIKLDDLEICNISPFFNLKPILEELVSSNIANNIIKRKDEE